MIQNARQYMLPDLKKMWKQCFGDADDYIAFYFDNRYREEDVLVYAAEDGRPVSMLSMLPAELVLGGGQKKGIRYIYAGATLPSHRNHGYYGRLLTAAKERAEAEDAALLLVPADEGLRGYYRKKGFIDAFRILEKNLEAAYQGNASSAAGGFSVEAIAPEAYKRLRDACFHREGYVCWDQKAVRYAVEETLFCGGFCGRLRYNGEKYGVLYWIEQNKILHIKEITAAGAKAEELAALLAGSLRLDSIQAAFYCEGLEKGGKEYAMVSEGLTGLKFDYFNLSLG